MASKKKQPDPAPVDVDEEPVLTQAQLERQQRESDIVAARMRGLSASTVALTYGVSERSVRRLCAAYRESNPTLRHADPMEVVDEMLEMYAAAIHELALISSGSTGAARVAAIAERMRVVERQGALLQAIGVLPHDLGTLSIQVNLNFVAEQIVTILTEAEVPVDVMEKIARALTQQPGLPAGQG